MEITKFANELPYPTVEARKDLSQAKLLMPNYAGPHGELTAVLTYSFQNYVSQKLPTVAQAMMGIAKIEMCHHRLLGDAIVKLGGYPVMGARTYWNGSMANYTLDPQKFLQQNIVAEETAILNYERTILNLDDESVKMLLERIILDEEIHINIFKELLKDMR
ncbi:MAG: manganese catalase family protein [Bacteroides sp.]|nr:manganese catalase family protein [Bacillota bacterium]MCM1393650.1 manganese catalase family protein [[Eubacterium] siraeum]MCM1455602.1 manganese catalase family protein [Bacteroides sp.]